MVYTALAGLHRTNSPATGLQQPVAPRNKSSQHTLPCTPTAGAYTPYICLSYAPIGVYGAGDCYRGFPRMSALGSWVKKEGPEPRTMLRPFFAWFLHPFSHYYSVKQGEAC